LALLLSLLLLGSRIAGHTSHQVLVRDVDGHEYEVVTIGSQVWLAGNLQATHAPDGKEVASYVPNDDSSQVASYGRLYGWQAAQQVCPKGWHLPSDAEWSSLESSLGSRAGVRLIDPQFWPKAADLDRPGFKARPAGYWNDQGFDDLFGTRAVFWTSTPQDEHLVWSRVLSIDSLRRAPQHPQYGFSVRCVRNGQAIREAAQRGADDR
jgi:uncharacterized protein (TIGR02145 family)